MRVASQLLVAATAVATVTAPVAGAAEISSSWEQEAQAPPLKHPISLRIVHKASPGHQAELQRPTQST